MIENEKPPPATERITKPKKTDRMMHMEILRQCLSSGRSRHGLFQFRFLRSTLFLIMPRVRNALLDSNQVPIYPPRSDPHQAWSVAGRNPLAADLAVLEVSGKL